MVEHTIQRVVQGKTLRLVKRDSDGYFKLEGFLPHLIAHEFGPDAPEPWDAYQEDALLAKYGVLIDTDVQYAKWITHSKAQELIELLGWGDAFAKAGGTEEDRGSAGSATDEDEDEGLGVGGGAKRGAEEAGGSEAAGAGGSPLKKLKAQERLELYGHDLAAFRNEECELALARAVAPLEAFSGEERVKLEALLQRILFPEGGAQPQFEESLQEVERTYPGVALKWNIPIDEHGNTALHWLCSIASVAMVRCVVGQGADRLPGDRMGETALVKSVKSVNNYDSGTFEELLDYMYPCLVKLDESNRTVLHHIVLTSGMPGCSAAAKYYLDILMGWIVKKQSRRLVVLEDGQKPDCIISRLDLNWFIINVLNAKDSNGDTCLNIASRLGNVSIVEALLDYGADPYIANSSGLRPIDFGAGVSVLYFNNETLNKTAADHNSGASGQAAVMKQKNCPPPDSNALITRLQSLLSSISKDYEQELKEHERKLHELHAQLNSRRSQLATSRDRLAKARQLKDEHALLAESVANIEASTKEEEANFAARTREMGINPDDYRGLEEFDADEPFRIDIIYSELDTILHQQFQGDLETMLKDINLNKVVEDILAKAEAQNPGIISAIPPAVLLRARIQAYKRNEKELEETFQSIDEKHKTLESKFRRVLSLCLKIEEDKVDGMLDGLLQAITNEDPDDIDIDEMQDFLRKHG